MFAYTSNNNREDRLNALSQDAYNSIAPFKSLRLFSSHTYNVHVLELALRPTRSWSPSKLKDLGYIKTHIHTHIR